MFNPMSSAELIRAIGEVLKEAAEPVAPDEFRRSQMLSAYSVARHLAAEEAARPGLEAAFRDELATILAGRPEAERVAEAAGFEALGEAVADLLAEARAKPEDADARCIRAAELRAALRRLCDREVAALADAA